jgi:hypothetical protein
MRQARSGNIASFVLRKNLGGGIVRIKFNEREPLGLACLVVALHLSPARAAGRPRSYTAGARGERRADLYLFDLLVP